MALKRNTPLIRRAVAAVGVTALALLAVAPVANAATASGAKAPTIDTYSGWDHSSYLYAFGSPNTTNYGQVITDPAGKTKLKDFTFYLADNTGTGTLTYRAEVYGWDGSKATTKVFESKASTLNLTAGDPTYYPVKVKTKKAAALTPGSQYVLFLTLDKDFEADPPNLWAQWACNYSDVYSGGDTVYLNAGGDESQWTTATWSSIPSYDFAMTAHLK